METSLNQLWQTSTRGTEWEELDVKEELEHIEKLAVRPRIPDDDLIFRIFRAIDIPSKQLSVVFLGQDPYPTYLRDLQQFQARGFSFSAPLGPLPLSLRVIYSEIIDEFCSSSSKKSVKPGDFSGDLSYLIGQGVFLLNSYLTIAQDPKTSNGIPKSHPSWRCFTVKVLSFIRRKCPYAVYLALGKQALDLYKQAQITKVLETDHPASIRFGGKNPFRGSGIFIEANKKLEENGLEVIDWVPLKEPIDINFKDDGDD